MRNKRPLTQQEAYKKDIATNPWPFYANYNEDNGLWSVYGVTTDYIYSNHPTYKEAEKVALDMERKAYIK